MSCWVRFTDGAVTPLDQFERSTYSLTVSTPDESVATVRRTPQSTFVVAQGEAEGRGALVRVELRICEECQKSKRKSKLAVGVGLLQLSFQSSSEVGGAESSRTSELQIPSQPSITTANQQPDSTSSSSTSTPLDPEATSTRSSTDADVSAASSTLGVSPARSGSGPENTTLGPLPTGEGQKTNYGNMLGSPTSPAQTEDFGDPGRTDSPEVMESDLVRTFRAMSDLEIGMYALVGVSCLAILAFLLNCTSHSLCFQNHKSPVQAGGGPKAHKHDWVWLGGGQGAPPPPQVSTLKLTAAPRQSLDSLCRNTLPAISIPALPERTATLGRNRTSSQQHFHGKSTEAVASRSATLLARPQRSEPLHSPTSKRNQVQFTTFTTLDIKHLSALKKNGVDLNWTQQQVSSQAPAPLADMPWPVVKPLGEAQ